MRPSNGEYQRTMVLAAAPVERLTVLQLSASRGLVAFVSRTLAVDAGMVTNDAVVGIGVMMSQQLLLVVVGVEKETHLLVARARADK